MNETVLLDAGVVTRCRHRVHLENDPAAGRPPGLPDPTGEQRRADAAAHRRAIADRLAAILGTSWAEVPPDAPDRAAATTALITAGAPYIWGAVLPADERGSRRGHVELLVRVPGGYLPVIVVRHKVTDPGSGATVSPLSEPTPAGARPDGRRKARPQPRDQMRLAHLVRLLQAAGLAPPDGPVRAPRAATDGADGADGALGGVIGLDADVVLWHDLSAETWPGGRSALAEYDARFADRVAIARAARAGQPPLAHPSRVTECRGCPWWAQCERWLRSERDVSLVLRGEDAVVLRGIGVSTVDALATMDPRTSSPPPLAGMPFGDAVLLSRAWLAGLTMVRRRPAVLVPRADVELDVDMESFGDAGAYLWGSWLSGADIGLAPGYRSFVTWQPMPTRDEARSFAGFWSFLTTVRARAAARGLTFRAFCYNEMAENRWLISSAQRFAGMPDVPAEAEVEAFITSTAWVDIFGCVRDQFLCAHGKGLKIIAPVAGFTWRDPEANGENSMRWYRHAVGMAGAEPDLAHRDRILRYNEDDVRATFILRGWMSSPQVMDIPYIGDL